MTPPKAEIDMLLGCDISHYNLVNKMDYGRYDFYIIKATEGKSFIDKKWKTHLSHVLMKKKLYGFYHYARPEYNTPEVEAEHFVKQVGKYAGNCIYTLDWEDNALRFPVQWALDWLNKVYELTGVKPLIYCQASYCKKLTPIFKANYGLWVAQWNKTIKKPNTGVYPFYAIWQYTNEPIDLDKFNGNIEQWYAYCRRG